MSAWEAMVVDDVYSLLFDNEVAKSFRKSGGGGGEVSLVMVPCRPSLVNTNGLVNLA